MNLITSFYRRQREGAPSLFLFHFEVRRIPVCLVIMQEESVPKDTEMSDVPGIYETAQHWLEEIDWGREVKRHFPKIAVWEQKLQLLKERLGTGFEKRKHLIVLVVNEMLVMTANKYKAYHVYTDYGKSGFEDLGSSFSAFMEAGAGILLTSAGFTGEEDRKNAADILRMEEMRESTAAEHRLREYGDLCSKECVLVYVGLYG